MESVTESDFQAVSDLDVRRHSLLGYDIVFCAWYLASRTWFLLHLDLRYVILMQLLFFKPSVYSEPYYSLKTNVGNFTSFVFLYLIVVLCTKIGRS